MVLVRRYKGLDVTRDFPAVTELDLIKCQNLVIPGTPTKHDEYVITREARFVHVIYRARGQRKSV